MRLQTSTEERSIIISSSCSCCSNSYYNEVLNEKQIFSDVLIVIGSSNNNNNNNLQEDFKRLAVTRSPRLTTSNLKIPIMILINPKTSSLIVIPVGVGNLGLVTKKPEKILETRRKIETCQTTILLTSVRILIGVLEI